MSFRPFFLSAVALTAFAAVVSGVSIPGVEAPSAVAATDAGVLFADGFARTSGEVVGGAWSETDVGTSNRVRLDGSAMVINSGDGAFVPRATRTFAAQTAGVVAWSFVFNWKPSAAENDYDLLMQLGDSATLVNPTTNPVAGVAADVRWSGSAVPGAQGQESFGYLSAGVRREVKRASGEVPVRVVADLDRRTYDVDIDTTDGVVEASGIPLGATRIDTIRIMTNALNSSNFTTRSFDTMTVTRGRPGGVFADGFSRPSGDVVGAGWVESDVGAANRVRLDASAMVLNSADGAFVPRATRTFAPVTSGVVAWSFVFNWKQSSPENTYDVLMQLGDSTTQVDPAVNATVGVGADVRWGAGVTGTTGTESFGYVSAGVRRELKRASGERLIRVVADLDAATYDVDIDTTDGVVEGRAIPLGATRIDTVRIMTNGLNSANFATRSFDAMAVDRVSAAVDDTTAPPLPVPVTIAEPAAGQVVIDNGPPGFQAVIQSAGGIRSSGDVSVSPNLAVMGGVIASKLASTALSITLPADAPPITSARLTLPYQETLLAGYPEADLRIHVLDEPSGLWIPVTTGQVIDQAANTVSVDVNHFSTYAVLKVRDAAAWKAFFQGVPIQCVAGAATVVDAALVLDNSNSMSTNDPTNLRVAGAKRFVERMRNIDRAGVITFASTASVRRPLTTLTTPTDRTAVNTAIDTAATLIGGTDVGSGIRAATTMLSAGTGVRVKAAILVTDGQNESPALNAPTLAAADAAAAAGVAVYTLGLGSAPDAGLLSAVAQRTGGTYTALATADQLVPVYEALIGNLVDTGVDTDGDQLTDCVERNGAFVPGLLNAGPLGSTPALDGFVETNPTSADTDGDGLIDLERDVNSNGRIDSAELGELRGPYSLTTNAPATRSTYQFLIDTGLDTFYVLRSDPRQIDTDGDGLPDAVEVRINGTDPRVAETGGFIVPGLTLPLNTLMQPSELTPGPTSATPNAPFVRDYVVERGGRLEPFRAPPLVVSYDANDDCVPGLSGFGYCEKLFAVAATQPDSNTFVCRFRGPCNTDVTQVRDMIRQIRAQQGIYTDDRRIRASFASNQANFTCVAWTGQPNACFTQSLTTGNPRPADLAAAITGVATRAAPTTNGGIRADPTRVNALANSVLNSVAIVAGVAAATAPQPAEKALTINQCYASPVLQRDFRRITIYQHPCDKTAIFMPGSDSFAATEHNLEAIRAGAPVALSYVSESENLTVRGFTRNWIGNDPRCAQRSISTPCDEYPYFTALQGGPLTATPPGVNVSLKVINQLDNSREGNALNLFYNVCGLKNGSIPREAFLVVPDTTLAKTIGLCRRP